MAERVREVYRGVTLIARAYSKTVRGKAWCDGREIVSLEGRSVDEVLTTLRQRVDEAFTVETSCGSVPYPSAEAYETALRAKLAQLTPQEQLMLRAHYHAPNRTLSTRGLGDAAAYATWTSARLHYLKVGRMVGESLLFQPRERSSGVPNWTLLLAEGGGDEGREDERQWRMRDEVAAALEAVGLV